MPTDIWVIFIWILGGAILLSSILDGAILPLNKLFGSDTKTLSSISLYFVIISICCFLGGLTAYLLFKIGLFHEASINLGILIGNIVGITISTISVVNNINSNISIRDYINSNSNVINEKVGNIGAIVGAFVGVILIQGWINGTIGNIGIIITLVIGAVIGVIVGWIVGNIFSSIGSFIILIIGGIVFFISMVFSKLLNSLFIILEFRMIVCNNCLRYSKPFESSYNNGTRYCEHCSKAVDRTKNPGKVIFTFGDYQVKKNIRNFILVNPDFKSKEEPIDVSEVYIDTKTCDKILLERFITYIHNYEPNKGRQYIQIFIKGNQNDIGGHLNNLIKNNFKNIWKIES